MSGIDWIMLCSLAAFLGFVCFCFYDRDDSGKRGSGGAA